MDIKADLDKSSIVNLTIEDLQEKYLCLNKTHSKLEIDLEQKLQEIYDCKRELSRLTALEAEYIQEIDSVQSKAKKECEKLRLKIQNLEEEKTKKEHEQEENVQYLEQCLQKKEDNITKLQEKLNALGDISYSKNDQNELDELQSKVTDLTNTIEKLSDDKLTLKEKCELMEKERIMYEEKCCGLKHDYEILSEKYYRKEFEVNEAQISIEALQEDYMLAKNELESVKSKPLQNGSQGNSLFAEVDDKRLEAQKNMTYMKSRYLEMQKERNKLLSQIAKLNSTNSLLCQRWENESNDRGIDMDELCSSYDTRIKHLESQIEMYRNEISTREKISAKNLESGEIEFMENRLETKNKEIESLKKECGHFSLSKMILSRQLLNSNTELRQWRAKATKLECDLGALQAEIEENKLENIPTLTQLQSTYYEKCLKNKQSSTCNTTKRMTLKEISKNLNTSAWTLPEENNSNRIDYSRQIKRSLLKESTNADSNDTCNEIVEGSENNELINNLEIPNGGGKRVQFTAETVDNSCNKNKVSRAGKVIICKPMILKKKC